MGELFRAIESYFIYIVEVPVVLAIILVFVT